MRHRLWTHRQTFRPSLLWSFLVHHPKKNWRCEQNGLKATLWGNRLNWSALVHHPQNNWRCEQNILKATLLGNIMVARRSPTLSPGIVFSWKRFGWWRGLHVSNKSANFWGFRSHNVDKFGWWRGSHTSTASTNNLRFTQNLGFCW